MGLIRLTTHFLTFVFSDLRLFEQDFVHINIFKYIYIYLKFINQKNVYKSNFTIFKTIFTILKTILSIFCVYFMYKLGDDEVHQNSQFINFVYICVHYIDFDFEIFLLYIKYF